MWTGLRDFIAATPRYAEYSCQPGGHERHARRLGRGCPPAYGSPSPEVLARLPAFPGAFIVRKYCVPGVTDTAASQKTSIIDCC